MALTDLFTKQFPELLGKACDVDPAIGGPVQLGRYLGRMGRAGLLAGNEPIVQKPQSLVAHAIERNIKEVRVRITGPNGEPIQGAQVSVRFHMPAMPAMGMSEMNAATDLQDQGGGFYRGRVELGSGGTWQVTITAQRNAQNLVTKRLNVSATGGM